MAGRRQLQRVVLRYRAGGSPYAEVVMALQYGDLYRGTIPADAVVPPSVEYFVEGYTQSGARRPLFMSSSRPARVRVVADGGPARKQSETAPRPPPPPEDVPVAPPPEPARAAPKASSGTHRAPGGGGAAAGALEEELALYRAEDTVVVATRREEKVIQVPAIASSFDARQIRALGARTVFDVLDVVPGLSVSRDVQGFYRVGVRGQRHEPELLFLLNGQRLNSVFDGRSLANLPVDNVERIEVLRGPGSSLYGVGAFLGVVNIVTSQEPGLRGSVSAGTFGSLDGHLAGARRFGALTVHADTEVAGQQGYKKAIDKDSLDAYTVAQEKRRSLEPAGYTDDQRLLLNVGAGIKWDLGGAGKATASLRWMYEDRSALIGLFDSVGSSLTLEEEPLAQTLMAGNDSRLTWQVLHADLLYERPIGGSGTLRLNAYFDDQYTDRLFQLSPRNFKTGPAPDQLFPAGLLEENKVGVRTLGLHATTDFPLWETNRLSLGAVVELHSLYDYRYATNYSLTDRYLGETLARPIVDETSGAQLPYPQELGEGAAASREVLALFAQDQWAVLERLTLTFGFRADAIRLPKVEGDQITGTSWVPSMNPRAGVVVTVSDEVVLKALYGRAFRPPTIQELAESIPSTTFNQGRFEGNPALAPAFIDTAELGIEFVQPIGEGRLGVRVNGFYEHISNPIARVDTTGNITPLRNREGVRVWGAEGEARLEPGRRTSVWVNASWFRAEDLETPAQARLLTDVPQARFNAGLSFPLGSMVNLDLAVRTGAERRNNSRSLLELVRRYRIPAYSVVTAQLRSEMFADLLEVMLLAHNVFDQAIIDDVPRPDRVPGLLPREGFAGFLVVRAKY